MVPEKRGMGSGSGATPMMSGGSNFTCSSCIDLEKGGSQGRNATYIVWRGSASSSIFRTCFVFRIT